MLSKFRSPGTIIACIALFVSLSGGAIAAKLITGKQVKNNSLTGADIKNGSVRGADIRPGTLSKKRLAKGVRDALAKAGTAGAAGPTGPQGAKGDTGPTGPKGDKGDRGDGQTPVTSSNPDFTPSNSNVKVTADGVTFGPFTNNNAGDSTSGGSYRFTALRGKGYTLADVAELTYTASYTSTHTPDTGDAPYLRVFIDDNGDNQVDHDVVFSPSTQPGACYGPGGGAASDQCDTSGRMILYEVHKGTVRYDDDPGETQDKPWDEVINAHKDDKIMDILVSVGNSQPGTTGGVLNSLRLELAGNAPTVFSFTG